MAGGKQCKTLRRKCGAWAYDAIRQAAWVVGRRVSQLRYKIATKEVGELSVPPASLPMSVFPRLCRGCCRQTLKKDNARDSRDDRRLEPLLDRGQFSAASSHFMQSNIEPFSAFLPPHIDRERSCGFGELDCPLGQIALASHPDFRRIFLRQRIPHQAQAQAKDGSFPVNHEIGRNRFTAQTGANSGEVITFAHNVGCERERGRLIRHRRKTINRTPRRQRPFRERRAFHPGRRRTSHDAQSQTKTRVFRFESIRP